MTRETPRGEKETTMTPTMTTRTQADHERDKRIADAEAYLKIKDSYKGFRLSREMAADDIWVWTVRDLRGDAVGADCSTKEQADAVRWHIIAHIEDRCDCGQNPRERKAR
jgi:hypothetical protein